MNTTSTQKPGTWAGLVCALIGRTQEAPSFIKCLGMGGRGSTGRPAYRQRGSAPKAKLLTLTARLTNCNAHGGKYPI